MNTRKILRWTGALAENPEDFATLMMPIHRWMNETPVRVPLTDLYDTVTGEQQGFQTRSAVGGASSSCLRKGQRQPGHELADQREYRFGLLLGGVYAGI